MYNLHFTFYKIDEAIILLFWKFFTQALIDGLSLVFK